MIKNDIAFVGIGLGGQTIAYEFQKRGYLAYLVNGSSQDNKTLDGAKNLLVLDGYDGLAGNRKLAQNALASNQGILKKILEIEEKIIMVIATGGGTTGSGCIPYICDCIKSAHPDKIVCAVLVMPRMDEAIQKRINAYEAAKQLTEDIDGMGAIIFVNNAAYTDLQKINNVLVNMLDAFFTDASYSKEANFDDSEKMRMLNENGAFLIAMLCDREKKTTTQEMIQTLTAKNIFLPINDDGVVSYIGIINQRNNRMDEQDIKRAVGIPENIFRGDDGNVNIVCASGLSFPNNYIMQLGKSAMAEQRERAKKRNGLTLLEELNMEEVIPKVEVKKEPGKKRGISFDLLRTIEESGTNR